MYVVIVWDTYFMLIMRAVLLPSYILQARQLNIKMVSFDVVRQRQ